MLPPQAMTFGPGLGRYFRIYPDKARNDVSTNQSSTISAVATLFVPVSDQDRALEFYVERLGFEKRADFEYGGDKRWVEVAPPESANALALVAPAEGSAAPTAAARCALTTSDIDGLVEKLRDHGIDVEDVGRAGGARTGLLSTDVTVTDPFPPQCCFRDPDGNRFLLVQPSTTGDE
jgi:catechol 2,3-dioxygenase-like lactoylglutathione lyase family enzyme